VRIHARRFTRLTAKVTSRLWEIDDIVDVLEAWEGKRMLKWQGKEVEARRAIEDRGFVVHDANIVFRANRPNIDLIIFAKTGASYAQVKSSNNPAGSDSVIIDGSVWTQEQLNENAPIFNKHDSFRASLIVIVDTLKTGETNFCIAPPEPLEELARVLAKEFAERPKRDGTRRSIAFRKELPRQTLKPWLYAWHLLGEGTKLQMPQSK